MYLKLKLCFWKFMIMWSNTTSVYVNLKIHCPKSVIVLTKNNNLTSFLKSIFSELGYIPVPSCPKSPREWNDSSLRLNCNETNKYHCAPYLSETSQLYEFCYRSLSISKGKWYKSFNPISLPTNVLVLNTSIHVK